MNAQLSFDFATVAAPAQQARFDPRSFWNVGMATSLPLFCELEDGRQQFTYMLPGVVEAIRGEVADVRIYAAPEYGYTIVDYPLHQVLAVNVPLLDLNRHSALCSRLAGIIERGLLAAGDAAMGAEIRARASGIAEVMN